VEFGYFSYSTGNNSWSNPANRSASSNDAGGASYPLNTDMAIFDGAGNNNGSCLADISMNVRGLQITSGYQNNLDLNGFQLTSSVSGISISGGGVSQGTANIKDNGDLLINGGVFTNISGTCFVSGNVQILGGSVNASNNILEFNGTADQSVTFASGIALNELNVNKASGNLNLLSDVTAINILDMNQGIINTSTFNLILGIGLANTGTLNYAGGKINGSFRRWINTSSFGILLFPMGNSVASALFSVDIVSIASAGGYI
jgi:hypothetical protein